MNLKEAYLQNLAVRDDLPEETREYVESELEKCLKESETT